MRQQSINYAKVLYDLNISEQTVQDTLNIFQETKELLEVLECKAIAYKKKEAVIKKIFKIAGLDQTMIYFLCYICKYNDIDTIEEIAEAFTMYARAQKQVLTATLYYVTAPNEQQIAQMKQKLCKDFSAESVELTLVEKPELLGGFLIEAQGQEFDWSLKGRIGQLRQNLLRR